MSDKKPVIFISYSHKDEPDKPVEGEVQWLSFVRTYLQPAVKNGVFDLFDDQGLVGGDGLDPKIEEKLRACDVFLLLISANSIASNYIVDTEIKITRERQLNKEDVHFYPLLLTPTPKIALDKLKDMVIRPKDAKPLSAFSYGERIQQMTDAADEIAAIAAEITSRRPPAPKPAPQPAFVHITGLPETAYERLVGREVQLRRLDDAWTDGKTNIFSLIAEGGAGKSALVNEWLKEMLADNYRGAETVLGWSFYSQGTKERATSAEQFLNWALEKLGIKVDTRSAAAKGEALAEVMSKRRVLLVLDGCEPLQHGLDKQHGELKDQGLRALLRRFAAMPAAEVHGLILLTSRLPIKDISRWKESSASVELVDQLSDEAGAALLRDNSVWGTDKELKTASRAFGGHPLALTLLASFLKETQTGDVRRRDHIRVFFADVENPRHDHAKRVMESYEKEWLIGYPALLAIMYMVGLFDRPVSGDCLWALRKKPAIKGLTDLIVNLDEGEWQRGVARLRDGKLLSPSDPSTPDALDAHPLVREWFGDRLKQTNEVAWKAAHSRLFDHLRRTTREGDEPTLDNLAPLYQAIGHGCRAGRHQEALETVYVRRICRLQPDRPRIFYSKDILGAFGSDLAAISWFFDKPYDGPSLNLGETERNWLLTEASAGLRAQGRISEALSAMRIAFSAFQFSKEWDGAANSASNIGRSEYYLGNISSAITAAEAAAEYIALTKNWSLQTAIAMQLGDFLYAAGRHKEALLQYQKATEIAPKGVIYAVPDYQYRDFLILNGNDPLAIARAKDSLAGSVYLTTIISVAIDHLTLGRAYIYKILKTDGDQLSTVRIDVSTAQAELNESVEGLRASAQIEFIPYGLLGRAAFLRATGDWDGVARNLDEIEEIADSWPMKLFLCEMALERARLAFARIETFAPLNGLMDDSPPKPVAIDAVEAARLKDEAAKQLIIAADYIKTCGYHKRDEELAELQAVLRGERKFANLPPRV